MKQKNIKVALIATGGGHFEQLINLSDLYNEYPHFWITNKISQTVAELINENVYFVKAGHYKKPWTYLSHFPFFIKIFVKEKPTHIISTGSGRTAFIAFLISKLLRIKFIYIESFSRVKNFSKFGELLIRFGQRIYTQWETSNNDKVEYIGPVLSSKEIVKIIDKDSGYIFVALGNRIEQFTRLLNIVEQLKLNGIIENKVKVQAGYTNYKSDKLEIFDFCTPEEIDKYIYNSAFVITQESAGIVTKCLKIGKKFIVMPRDYNYGELPSKSDMKEDLQYKLEELGYTKVVNNISDMEIAIKDINKFKVGYNFNNSFTIQKLKILLENN